MIVALNLIVAAMAAAALVFDAAAAWRRRHRRPEPEPEYGPLMELTTARRILAGTAPATRDEATP